MMKQSKSFSKKERVQVQPRAFHQDFLVPKSAEVIKEVENHKVKVRLENSPFYFDCITTLKVFVSKNNL